MSAVTDQSARDRFIREAGGNFAVRASAGAGKTRAIVERVVHMAMSPDKRVRAGIPSLVVVTYTKRAAGEMQQRARNAILHSDAPPSALADFQQAFFGTIHSFCLALLNRHGRHLGLPARLQSLETPDDLWAEFLRERRGDLAPAMEAAARGKLLRHVTASRLLELAKNLRPRAAALPPPDPFPAPDPRDLLATAPKGAGADNIREGQTRLRRWIATCASKEEAYVPLPECPGKGKFGELWTETFAPLRGHLARTALRMAHDIAEDFLDFRVARGELTFDDQILLAERLLHHPRAGPDIRTQGFRVILDEAQDTDLQQFHTLLEATRPPEADQPWSASSGRPPRPGHFCMVGDPQQSIYSSRADLEDYLDLEDQLVASGGVERLHFEVTFRCDREVIATVNAQGGKLLHGRDGQPDYVPLQPRPQCRPGQVVALRVGAAADLPRGARGTIPVGIAALHEAKKVAAWIQSTGLHHLRARSWSEVAILCPRRKLFAPLREALAAEGLEAQIQSQEEIMGDRPAFAWAAALLTLAARPRHGYEIVGVLRELFGLSDDALAAFARGNGARFQIAEPTREKGEVADALNLLVAAREAAAPRPLRDAAGGIFRDLHLRDRLLSLPESTAESVDAELDALLARAALAESGGLSPGEWAEELRELFSHERPGEAVRSDAVQLITCQKAKGLEWDAVILPFLHRPIQWPPGGDFEMRKRPEQHALQKLFGSDHVAGEHKELMHQRQMNELRRLFYVSMTRPRHTLVLVDDRDLFGHSESKPSFAACLGMSKEQRLENLWPTLASSARAVPGDSAEAEVSTPSPTPGRLSPWEETRRRALEAASRFPRRQLPHELAGGRATQAHEPEARGEIEPDWPPSARVEEVRFGYGTWWHETCAAIPWSGGRTAWKAIFESRLAACPDPGRGRREWNLFLESDLAAELEAPGQTIHPEMPFLFSRSASEAVEGVMDLALFREKDSAWRVLDWKTDVIPENELASLCERYTPQLWAYADALEKMTGKPATPGIYSTSTGQWLPLDLP